MSKKRVVFAIDRMNIGGAPSVVFEQMKQIDKSKFEVFLLTLYRSKQANYFDRLDFLDEDHIVSFSLYKRSLLDIRTWFKVFSFLKKNNIDVVYTHLFLTNVVVRTAAWLARVPTIISTEHSTYFNKHTWQIIVDRILAKVTTSIVVARPEIADFTADQEKISRDKFIIIANPLSLPEPDTQVLDELSEKYIIKQNSFNVLTIGRFQEEKGHQYLIDAMKLLQDMDITCMIVGHGPLHEKLEQRIKAHGLESSCKVIKEPEKAKYFYYLADLFVLPSLREGQSIVTYEAFAAGLPVVASNLPTLQDVVEDGVNGYLIPTKDITALAAKIESLYEDREVYKGFQEHTSSAIESYQNMSSIKHLENLFIK
ncbi:MAG: glycosyltransferase [Patescibacteria group bacterium]